MGLFSQNSNDILWHQTFHPCFWYFLSTEGVGLKGTPGVGARLHLRRPRAGFWPASKKKEEVICEQSYNASSLKMFLRMCSTLLAKGPRINLESVSTITCEALSMISTVTQQSLKSHKNPGLVGRASEPDSETRRPSGVDQPPEHDGQEQSFGRGKKEEEQLASLRAR